MLSSLVCACLLPCGGGLPPLRAVPPPLGWAVLLLICAPLAALG